jgi:hypothetical protein
VAEEMPPQPAVEEVKLSSASPVPQPPRSTLTESVSTVSASPNQPVVHRAKHQSYQEWLELSQQALQRNLLLQKTLQQRAAAEAPGGYVEGGASSVRLQEWCDRMRR